jgi:hypothetical protein
MPQKKKPNPFNLEVAIRGLNPDSIPVPDQSQQQVQQNPYDLMTAMNGLRGPDTRGLPQLPQGPSNADRPIGKEPLGDLVDFFGGLLGIQNPISPEASRMTQVAGGLGMAAPLLPGIYSRLQQAISGIPSKMTAISKAGQIASQVPEEARATGLLDYIKSFEGKPSRTEPTGMFDQSGNMMGAHIPQGQIPTSALQQYVQDNPLGLTEGVGGGKPQPQQFAGQELAAQRQAVRE